MGGAGGPEGWPEAGGVRLSKRARPITPPSVPKGAQRSNKTANMMTMMPTMPIPAMICAAFVHHRLDWE